MKSISELRQDIVSGDWVVIATGRAKRPHDFSLHPFTPLRQSKKTCAFETVLPSASLVYADSHPTSPANRWWVQVVPNKYPAFGAAPDSRVYRAGPYQWRKGVGTHDVIISRDHDRPFGLMSDAEAEVVVRAYQDRHLVLKEKKHIEYISIFHSHGRAAGATIIHPHSQMIGVPVIPPDVGRSIVGSAAYYHLHRQCVHCVVARFERYQKRRVVYENDAFLVFAPFASRTAFELRILPKAHSPQFEAISAADRFAFARALRAALAKLHRGLKNPDYNFFFHTAPTGEAKKFGHYHWHVEILPKTAVWAGFEIATGIEISVVAPEEAAEFLRKIKV